MKPKLATERQKLKMNELGINFDDSTTLDEAAELIRRENKLRNNFNEIRRVKLNDNCMVVASEWED